MPSNKLGVMGASGSAGGGDGYELYSWGQGSNGKTAQGSTLAYSVPTQVGTESDWATISIERSSGLGVKTDGTLWSWGGNAAGQLGHGDIINRSSPTQVGSLTDWAFVAAARLDNSHCGAIKTDGTLWMWGQSTFGVLGDGTTINKSSPVQVGTDTDWARVVCGHNSNTFAIKTTGTLWAWGRDDYGALGNNADGATSGRSAPLQIGTDDYWSEIVAPNTLCGMALRTDGTLWSWGYQLYGNGGLGNVINRSSPTQVGSLTDWAAIAAGNGSSLATKTDGTLWSWGYANNGSLGLGDVIVRSSPTQIGSLTDWETTQKAIGITQQGIAIKTDGTLWSWGGNFLGALGNASTVNASSPVQVGTDTTWVEVGAPSNAGMALKS